MIVEMKIGEGCDMEEIKMDYDSNDATLKHIRRVNQLLLKAATEILERAQKHDKSKLESPEKEGFDLYTPKLNDCTYGSEEYKGYLYELSVVLQNHYKYNSHHPEHYQNGIHGFDIFDLIEMFFDWRAASERHADGDIFESIAINTKRFNLSPQLVDILTNTAKRYFHKIKGTGGGV